MATRKTRDQLEFFVIGYFFKNSEPRTQNSELRNGPGFLHSEFWVLGSEFVKNRWQHANPAINSNFLANSEFRIWNEELRMSSPHSSFFFRHPEY